MGGPYNIPRNYKGESKILFIFSTKSFITTAVGGLIGVVIWKLFGLFGLSKVGLIFIVILALLGYVLGTFKIPKINKFEITRKNEGEYIDQVIINWIKFKSKKNRIYVYRDKKEEKVNVK